MAAGLSDHSLESLTIRLYLTVLAAAERYIMVKYLQCFKTSGYQNYKVKLDIHIPKDDSTNPNYIIPNSTSFTRP